MEANVIVLDWSRISQMDYMTAIYSIPSVGQGLGNMLNFISTVTGAPLTNMHLAGFSLGSHVVGNAGRTIQGRFARVTGMNYLFNQLRTETITLLTLDLMLATTIHAFIFIQFLYLHTVRTHTITQTQLSSLPLTKYTDAF